MPSLKGDVEILGLGNLFQLLSMNRREGIMTLIKGPDRKTIHFSAEGIRLLSSTMRRVNKLGKILLRRRQINKQDLEALLKEQKLLGWKLGQIAITSGLVKKKDIEEALREQVEEEIFDMFMWQNAAFEFHEGKTPREKENNPLAGLTFGTNVTSLILEAARRHDELMLIRKILDDDEMVIQKFDFDIQAEELSEDLDVADTVLPLINGKNTLKEILNQSLYPRYATMRAIHSLFIKGYIKAHDRKGQKIRFGPSRERVR